MADMWTLINRELSRLEEAERGTPDTSYAGFAREAIKVGQQERAWKERKNIQRQEMMTALAKDTSRMYSNEDVKVHRDRFQKYFDRHKGSMDETSLEIGHMMLGDYDIQMKKNDSFDLYAGRQDEEMQKVIDFTKTIEVGKEYGDKEIEEFRKVVGGYTNYTEEFANKHADRLQLAGNQHINKNLAHGAYVNDFMLDSFFDDKKIDRVEYKANKEAIARNTVQPIKDYNDYQSSLIKSSSKALVEQIEGNVQLYKNFKSIQGNKIPVPKEYVPGEQTGQYYDDLEEETQNAIDSQVLNLGKEIGRDNRTHIDRHGTGYVEYQHKDLFKTSTTTTTTTPTTTPAKTPSGEKKAKIDDSDVTTIGNWIDKTGHLPEFKKAKKKAPDMTLKEFLENRPDLVEGAKKESKKWETISTDAKKYLDRKYDFKKHGQKTEKIENGKKVKYTTYYMSPDSSKKDLKGRKYRKKIVSTYDLKNSKRNALNYLGATLSGSSSSWVKKHDKLANAKLKSIKEVYDPYKMKWVATEIKEV